MNHKDIKVIVEELGGCQHVASMMGKTRMTIWNWTQEGARNPDKQNIEKLRRLYGAHRKDKAV